MRGGFLVLALVVASLAHLHSGDGAEKQEADFWNGPFPRPPFFSKVSIDARKEYAELVYDMERIRSEIYEDELEWGVQNGIEEDVRAHQEARDVFYANHVGRVTEEYEKLPETFMKTVQYLKDPSLTQIKREKTLHRHFKAMTPELRSLVHASLCWNIDKVGKMEIFPSYRKRKATKEAMVNDEL